MKSQKDKYRQFCSLYDNLEFVTLYVNTFWKRNSYFQTERFLEMGKSVFYQLCLDRVKLKLLGNGLHTVMVKHTYWQKLYNLNAL